MCLDYGWYIKATSALDTGDDHATTVDLSTRHSSAISYIHSLSTFVLSFSVHTLTLSAHVPHTLISLFETGIIMIIKNIIGALAGATLWGGQLATALPLDELYTTFNASHPFVGYSHTRAVQPRQNKVELRILPLGASIMSGVGSPEHSGFARSRSPVSKQTC